MTANEKVMSCIQLFPFQRGLLRFFGILPVCLSEKCTTTRQVICRMIGGLMVVGGIVSTTFQLASAVAGLLANNTKQTTNPLINALSDLPYVTVNIRGVLTVATVMLMHRKWPVLIRNLDSIAPLHNPIFVKTAMRFGWTVGLLTVCLHVIRYRMCEWSL